MGFEERPADGPVTKRLDGPLSDGVVLAVAEAAGVGPTELRTLNGVVDPDALDSLFRGDAGGTVSFEYEGYVVTVRATGEIVVREPADAEL